MKFGWFMTQHYIVMADVVRSTSYDGNELMGEFKRIVEECNYAHRDTLLSPFTITLGDEFQGVAASLSAAVDSILFLEDRTLTVQPVFSLRYVLVYGAIDTPINPTIAHGMVGSGLTSAREMLTKKRRGRPRFQLDLGGGAYTEELRMVFRLLELLSTHWKEKDYILIRELLWGSDDKEVALRFGKTASQIWKRKKTLQIEEYLIAKELLRQTVNRCEGK
ncbi:SatD family protein [Massilia sp. GCM10023247]|uniref:SatD family protein n=1 Tax=Massilia sp. GCM10023247 TaxID=3252643 RepID=UPI00361B983F